MNLRRGDEIMIAVVNSSVTPDGVYRAKVQKVGQEIRCAYKVDTSGGRAYSNFGPIFYDVRLYTVRRRDEGRTWCRVGDPEALDALKAVRALLL